MLARDLVNEPANVLYPEEFARRAGELKKIGVEVEVFDVPAMKKLGMNALLGEGRVPARSQSHGGHAWNGGKRGADPLAFVGKGVCFDTGGISIKPAGSMEDMKGDMAGAACVVGLMRTLAERKAKVNAVGAIGLVENMPDGNAQRPGDIVTTMSGQTIEIINTDAEGRLVLADVLHYVNTRVHAEAHDRSGDADRGHHHRAGTRACWPVCQRRQVRRTAAQGRRHDRRATLACRCGARL